MSVSEMISTTVGRSVGMERDDEGKKRRRKELIYVETSTVFLRRTEYFSFGGASVINEK